jgi:hypothetical protein
MPLDASPYQLPAGAVLELSAGRAEWCSIEDGGKAEVGSADVVERTPQGLAAAAVAARGAVGAVRRTCTLTLGSGLAGVRLLRLPELKRSEVQKVLQRKAAALIEAPASDVVWQALEMRDAEGSESKERPWLLAAARASELRELRTELRRQGFQVRRIVPGQLATLDLARAALAQRERAAISVHFAPTRISIALFCADQLVHHDELEGDFLGTPLLAASLLQTVKTTAGYWRKLSRGAALEQIVVIGLPPERGTLLGHALEASLPGAQIRVLPGTQDGATAGRAFAIGSALVEGGFALSLSARAPLRRVWSGVAVAASVLAVAGFGVVQRRVRVRALDELSAQTERMRQRAATLEQLAHQHDQALASTQRVEQKYARLYEIGDRGLRHEEWLEAALLALHGRAELATLDLRADAGGATLLELEAEAPAEPAAFAVALDGIERALAASAACGAIAFELPTEVGTVEAGLPLRFGLSTQGARLP